MRIRQLLESENCKFGFKFLHHELPVQIEEISSCDHTGKTLEKKSTNTTPVKSNYLINQWQKANITKTV